MYIRLFNGKRFDYSAEDYASLTLEECVHAVPFVNRWCGQVKSPVTLSRHSNLVGFLSETIARCAELPDVECEAAHAAGLCHDFVEMTTNDIPAPLKQFLTFKGQSYKDWEEEMILHLTRGLLSRSSQWAGKEHLVINPLIDGTVALADRIALVYESWEFHPLWKDEDHVPLPPVVDTYIPSPLVRAAVETTARFFLREPEQLSVKAFQDDCSRHFG